MKIVLSILLLIIFSTISYLYYEKRKESLRNNPWTGVWSGSVPGVPAFTNDQLDYYRNDLVRFNICGFSESNLQISSLSKIFPSNFPKVKYSGAKNYYLANFKGKNGTEINATLNLNQYSTGEEIRVTILDDGKVYMLKDKTFYLKRTNEPARCFIRRQVSGL